MSRLFWLGLLLSFSGLGLAEESASKQSTSDLSQSTPSKTETPTSAEATPVDASSVTKSGTPASSSLPPESASPAGLSVSNTEIKKESQETSISNSLDSSAGGAASEPVPEVLKEQSLNGSNSEAPANSSNAGKTESSLKAGDASTESKDPKVFQTDKASSQAAPGMNVENESAKENPKENSKEEVDTKKPESSQSTGTAGQAVKTPSGTLNEGQELPVKQQPPASTPVYYSPVSKIDMAKQKPVYGDRGDGKVKFGTWMISLGSAKSNYSKADGYKDFYGSFSNTLDLGVDWFFLRHTYAAAGLGGRFSYYTDKGSRQTKAGTKAPGSSSFTVLSKVLTLQGVISPLPWHWIVFKGWAGRQYDSFEETRDNEASTSTTTSETGEQPKLLISPGKRNGTVKGFSVLFDISFLDSRSIKSMKPALGIDSLYIAPFKEVYEQRSVNGINLTRNLSGVMLVFGSAI